MVREPDATMQPTPQDHQLMSKRRVLSFKPQPRSRPKRPAPFIQRLTNEFWGRASVLLPASARLSCLIDPALRIDHSRSFSGAFQFQLS
jgi:hypothetical protein